MSVLGLVIGSVAHPLHTSYTEVTRERDRVELSIRLFADDFGSALDSLSRLPSSRGADRERVAREYLNRAVTLSIKGGETIRLEWCGMRTADGLTWLCARSSAPVPRGKLTIRNALMFDRFPDQISIVRLAEKSKARTLVLSARAPVGQLD